MPFSWRWFLLLTLSLSVLHSALAAFTYIDSSCDRNKIIAGQDEVKKALEAADSSLNDPVLPGRVSRMLTAMFGQDSSTEGEKAIITNLKSK